MTCFYRISFLLSVDELVLPQAKMKERGGGAFMKIVRVFYYEEHTRNVLLDTSYNTIFILRGLATSNEGDDITGNLQLHHDLKGRFTIRKY